jgi:hypothetical protein
MISLFTEQQLTPVLEGIRKFIRLQGLIHDPNPLVWGKWLADESDLKAALRSVADAFKQTEPMIGKRKYVGVDYDAPKSVKRDLMNFLTTTDDGKVSATAQKRNLPMYLLVIEPAIDLFYAFDHRGMVDNADNVIDQLCEYVDETTSYGTYDDALVAQHQVREMMRIRDEARKEEAQRKSKRRKSRDPMAELFASLGIDPEEEREDDPL